MSLRFNPRGPDRAQKLFEHSGAAPIDRYDYANEHLV